MLKSYKFRLYPNKSQEKLLNMTYGSVRFLWNQSVATYNSYDKELNPKPVYKTSTELRNEFLFLKEVSAAAIQQKEIDFKEFKNQKFNNNRKTKLGKPKFKKKGHKDSYRLPNQKFTLNQDTSKIKLEKIGWVKVVLDRVIPNCVYKSVTISKTSSNQHFVSILVEHEIEQFEKTNKAVGIDVGLKVFATLSDGTEIENPKYFRKNQAKLRKLQRRLSRKKKGSSRYKKSKLKVARLHQKISNQRDFFLHNVSTNIVKSYDVIGIEDLNVAGMVKNHKLAKSISDASFSKFKLMLEYKAKWYGKEVIKVGRFFPSSKQCFQCNNIKKDLTLADRVYNCEVCGHSESRDWMASKNIEKEALRVRSAILA